MFKRDIATTIWRLDYNAHALVVKRYNTRNTWHAIRRCFRRSRAKNCWEMSKVFTRSGISTPPGVAIIQEWLGPLKLRSWFINQYVQGEDLDHYLHARSSDRQPGANKIEFVYDKVRQLFENLRSHRLAHGDLKATNILLADDKLYLIDLDAAHQYKFGPGLQRARHKDWARFMKNWQYQREVQYAFKTINPDTLNGPGK